jgi:NTP pyrophosphatase (non-canonical NTP hydrolase)
MELNKYQELAMQTALPVVLGDDGINYCALKLNGESGEIAELVGKWMRGDFGAWALRNLDEHDELRFLKELGDVLWYLAAISDRLGFRLETVAQMNIAKLRDRKERGVLRGSGSSR